MHSTSRVLYEHIAALDFVQRNGVEVVLFLEDAGLQFRAGIVGGLGLIDVHTVEITALTALAGRLVGNHPASHVEIALSFGGQFDAALAADRLALQRLVTLDGGIEGLQIFRPHAGAPC